jgi:redox-sensitive bicupin YhaK (pirin superfamily)
VIEIRAGAARYETVQSGITTRHCFSSGSHYDPGNTAFGSLIALDEHVVAPGAGFGRHAHRGVEIVSWVLDGTLRHEDAAGRVALVEAGTVLHQSAGSGIEHSECNASDTEPLRFVQLVALADPPLSTRAGNFTVVVPSEPIQVAAAPFVHLFVTRGIVTVDDQELTAGDSARIRDAAVTVVGDGELLVWCNPVASGQAGGYGHGDDRDS